MGPVAGSPRGLARRIQIQCTHTHTASPTRFICTCANLTHSQNIVREAKKDTLFLKNWNKIILKNKLSRFFSKCNLLIFFSSRAFSFLRCASQKQNFSAGHHSQKSAYLTTCECVHSEFWSLLFKNIIYGVAPCKMLAEMTREWYASEWEKHRAISWMKQNTASAFKNTPCCPRILFIIFTACFWYNLFERDAWTRCWRCKKKLLGSKSVKYFCFYWAPTG